MARELGLSARVAAVLMVGVLVIPRIVHADDPKIASQSRIDARAAYAKIKTLAGDWKAQTIDEPKIDDCEAKRENHMGNLSVT
jgi:hypothetical protein